MTDTPAAPTTPEYLRIGITNRMILGGMSGPDALRLLDEYVAARSTPAEALPQHPFVGEQRSPTHCLLFVEGGTCLRAPDDEIHLSKECSNCGGVGSHTEVCVHHPDVQARIRG